MQGKWGRRCPRPPKVGGSYSGGARSRPCAGARRRAWVGGDSSLFIYCDPKTFGVGVQECAPSLGSRVRLHAAPVVAEVPPTTTSEPSCLVDRLLGKWEFGIFSAPTEWKFP